MWIWTDSKASTISNGNGFWQQLDAMRINSCRTRPPIICFALSAATFYLLFVKTYVSSTQRQLLFNHNLCQMQLMLDDRRLHNHFLVSRVPVCFYHFPVNSIFHTITSVVRVWAVSVPRFIVIRALDGLDIGSDIYFVTQRIEIIFLSKFKIVREPHNSRLQFCTNTTK